MISSCKPSEEGSLLHRVVSKAMNKIEQQRKTPVLSTERSSTSSTTSTTRTSSSKSPNLELQGFVATKKKKRSSSLRDVSNAKDTSINIEEHDDFNTQSLTEPSTFSSTDISMIDSQGFIVETPKQRSSSLRCISHADDKHSIMSPSDAVENDESFLEYDFATKQRTAPLLCTSNAQDRSSPNAKEDDKLFMDPNVTSKAATLDRKTCDEAVRNGEFLSFVQKLRSVVLLAPPENKKKKKRQAKAEAVGLQVAMVCSRIARLIESCSDKALRDHGADFSVDLGICLPVTVRFMVNWESADSTPRVVALRCLIRVMRRTATLCVDHLFDFAQVLAFLLEKSFPINVRVDAACTLTSFLAVDRADMSVHDKIDQESSSIISVVSTAALISNDRGSLERLKSLLLLAKDPILSSKLRCRRCVVMATTKQLKKEESLCQDKALEVISFLLQDEETSPTSATASNMNLLVEQVTVALEENECHSSRMKIIRSLRSIFSVPVIEHQKKWDVLDLLFELSRDDTVPVKVQVEAANAFVFGVNKMNAYVDFFSELSVLVVSHLAAVRHVVFRELDDAFLWHAQVLSAHEELPDLLDSFCILISNGSPEDCASSLQLCRQIAAEEAGQKCMYVHKLFLQRLVGFVIAFPKNRPAFINAVDVILDLLESDEGLNAFLPFAEVLPWLVRMANRTTDEALKERFVKTILRFGNSVLETF